MVVDSSHICYKVEAVEHFLVTSAHNQWLLIFLSVEQHGASEHLIAVKSPVVRSNYVGEARVLLESRLKDALLLWPNDLQRVDNLAAIRNFRVECLCETFT